MRRRRVQGAAVALIAALLAAVAWPSSHATADTSPTVIGASVGATPTGQPMPPSFIGFSMEYGAVHAYTGRDPRSVNPVLIALLKALTPGAGPVLRIGGDSADWTWWPVRGVIPPQGISYTLTKGWLRTTRALARDSGGKLILDINLATRRPALARAEAQALLAGLGRDNVAGLEIGNEPDLYGVFTWFRDRRGRVAYSRPRSYSPRGYLRDFARWRAALPRISLLGPSFSRLAWMPALEQLLRTQGRFGTVSFHRYPLGACVTDPGAPTYPSQANLLSDNAAAGLAASVAPYVGQAHTHHMPFRLTELNSASCRGAPGLSDTFASALWFLDALFNLAQTGVDAVNVHTLPGSAYEPFTFDSSGATWSAFVHPDYYGLLMFTRAFPPGARLLAMSAPGGPVKVWATQAPDGHVRVTMINKDPANPATVKLTLPGSGGPASLERLTAPSLSSTDGVTLGGQSFGDSTTSGTLPPPSTETVDPLLGAYSVTLPAGSAALLTR